jgi:hypothetical protein
MFALLVAMLLSAEPSTCSADAECVLFTPCDCGCCPAESKAMTQAEAKKAKQRCATLGECDTHGGCPDVACTLEEPGAFKAVCKANACVKEKVATAPAPNGPAECTKNDDCAMAHDCTCECCPAPFQAMPRKKADALREKCSRLGPCGRDPKECVGVSCTRSSGGDAVCRAGRCVRGGR